MTSDSEFFDLSQFDLDLSVLPANLDLAGFSLGLQESVCDLPLLCQDGSQGVIGSPQGQDGSQGHSSVGDFPVECDLESITEILQGDFQDDPFPGAIESELQDFASAVELLPGPEGCHSSYPTVLQPSARTGSRAFSYIPHDALLETDGIQALSRQALVTPGHDGTLKGLSVEPNMVTGKGIDGVLCGTMNGKVPHTAHTSSVTPKMVPCTMSSSFPLGTQTVQPKLVPETSGSFPSGNVSVPNVLNRAGDSPICGTQLPQTRSASVPCVTHDTKMPDRVGSVPIPCGTQTVDIKVTVPDQTTGTSMPCGTQTVATKQVQESAGTCHSTAYGTVPINTALIQVSESATLHVTQTTNATNDIQQTATKKRVRKRKNASETVRKTRKYEQGPCSNQQEERKRQDAIRARRCREKNRSEIQMLRDKVALMEQEKSAMVKELAGREIYEAVIRKLLLDKTGMRVLPFSTSSTLSSASSSVSDKMAPPQPQTTG